MLERLGDFAGRVMDRILILTCWALALFMLAVFLGAAISPLL